MATEAEIPEAVSISITKVELENKYLTSKQQDTAADELSVREFKTILSGNTQPPETVEFSEQTENIQIASDLSVQTAKEGNTSNASTSEVDPFFESPSVTKLAHEETSKPAEYCQADEIQLQEDKEISQDQTPKFDITDEARNGKNEVMERTEEEAEETSVDLHVELIANQRVSVEENSKSTENKFNDSQENEKETTNAGETAEFVSLIHPVEDKMHDLNKTDSSLRPETGKILQTVENPETFKEVPEIRSQDVIKESPRELNDQTGLLEKIAETDSTTGEKCKHYENPEEKIDASFAKDEGLPSVGNGLDSTDASTGKNITVVGSNVVVGSNNTSQAEIFAAKEDHQRGMSGHEGKAEEILLLQNEQENENLERSVSMVSEGIHAAASSTDNETIKSISEVTAIECHEAGLEVKGNEDAPIQNDAAGANGIPREENLLRNVLTESTYSVETKITDKDHKDPNYVPVKEELKECEKLDKSEPEEVDDANEASRGEAKHCDDKSDAHQSTHRERVPTTELSPQISETDLEKLQEFGELNSEENHKSQEAGENVEETVQNKEEAGYAESHEIATKSEALVMVKDNDLVGDEIVKQNFEVDRILEAAPVMSVEDESDKAEIYAEKNNMVTEEVQAPDATKTTGTGEINDEQIIKDPFTEETVHSSHNNEKETEKSEEDNSREEIIGKLNTDDLPLEAVGEGDDERETEKSEGEIFVGSGAAEDNESSAQEAGPPVESSRDMLDTSIVKQEESVESGSKNVTPTEASPEEKRNEISSVSLSRQNHNDAEFVKVKERLEESEQDLKQSLEKNEIGEMLDTPVIIHEGSQSESESLTPKGTSAEEKQDEEMPSDLVDDDKINDEALNEVKQTLEEGEDDIKQNLQKNETGEMPDISVMKQEEGLQNESKNLSPTETLAEEKRNEEYTTMMTEETDRDVELDKKEVNVETCEEDSKQILQKNEAGEMLDSSLAKEEKNLQDQDKNLNPVEASIEEKRTEDSATMSEESGNEEELVEAKGNVEKDERDSQDIEAVAPDADNLEEKVVQNLDEIIDKTEKIEESATTDRNRAKMPEYSKHTEVVSPNADNLEEEVAQNQDETPHKEERTKENKVGEMAKSSEHTEVLTPNADSLDEEVTQNLDETPQKEEPEHRTKENKLGEMPAHSEQTVVLTSNADTLEEEVAQNLDETPKKEEEPEEKTKENQVEEMPAHSKQREVLPPNANSLKEEVAQNLDETPQREEEPEEINKPNKVEEMPKQEECEINQSKEIETQSIEGRSTVEDKESLGDEPEKEVPNEAKTTGIEEANKEHIGEKNITFLSPKLIEEAGQSSKANESKSEKFEQEDNRDQLIEKSNAEDPSAEAVVEGLVQDFEYNAKEYYEHTEVGTNADNLEKEAAQNQDETPQKEEELEERTKENKVEEMPESSEYTGIVPHTADSMEEEVAQNLDETPQKEKEPEEKTKEKKVEVMPAHFEQTEVVTPNVDTLEEEVAQNLDETPQKEEEAEEKTKENQVEEIPMYSEQTEVVTPNAVILEEEVAQNLDETPQKEEGPEERTKENKVEEMPKQEEHEVNQSKDIDTQSVEGGSTAEGKESLGNEPEIEVPNEAKTTGIEDANKEQIVEKNITFLSLKSIDEEAGQSSKENKSKPEKFDLEDNRDQLIGKSNAEDPSAEATVEGPVQDLQDIEKQYSKHIAIVTPNADNLEEQVTQNQDETPHKEEEPEKTKENKVEEMPESSEHTEVVTDTADSLEEEVAQNQNETSQKEEEPEEKTKENKVEAMPAHSEQTEVVTSNLNALEEEVRQILDETPHKKKEPKEKTKENQVEEMPENSEQIEVATPNVDTLEEEVAQNLNETPQKDEEPQERTKENKVEEMPKQEEREINQSKDIETRTIEGGSMAKDKESLGDEPEKEVPNDAKTTCIEDANKEHIVEKNITFLSPKSIEEEVGRSSKENETKSEKFEHEDNRDQPIEKSKEAAAEGPVEDFEDNAKEDYEHIEVFTNTGNLEKEVAQNQNETPQKEEELEERPKENKVEEMPESSEHTDIVTHTADSMEEGVAQNLDETPQKDKEPEEKTKEKKLEVMPAHFEQAELVTPNIDTSEEEVAQNLDETPQKEEEVEEKTKENQMEEIPVYSEQTEVVTPNADILEEEVAQNLDETPQKEEEPEERTKENNLEEMPKQEVREVNQSKDIETQCVEGGSTVEDKESSGDELEIEVQDEAQTTGIEDANKVQVVQKNIAFLSLKSIEEETGQSSKENESKSEKFELEDRTDQLIEKSNAEDPSTEAVAEGPVKDFQDKAKEYYEQTEVVTPNADTLEEEIAQNQDETPQKEEELEERTEENKAEEMLESSEHTEVVTYTADSMEEEIARNLDKTPQKEEETKENKEEAMPAHSEQTEVVSPNANTLDEETAQNLHETPQKEEEAEEKTKENQMEEIPVYSEQTEVVTPNADILEEEVAQNLDETPQKEEEPEERTKENNLEEMPKREVREVNQSKDIETQIVEGGSTDEDKESLGDELEIEVQDEAKTTGIEDANKEQVVQKTIAFLSPKSFEEETGQSSKENESKSEKFELEDRTDQLIEKSNAEDPSTEAVAECPVKDFQDKAKEYYEQTEVVTPNADTLEEEIGQNQGEAPQKEEELEERTEENKAEEMLESSEHTEVVTYTADSVEEEIARNLDKTPQKEEETKENKEEAMPAHSEQTEVVSPNANTLDEETAQILHETPQKEEEAEEKTKENQMEEIPVYSEQTEVVTPNADILEEEVAQNLDETPQKEEEPEERTEENNLEEMPKQEVREVNQSKDIETQSIEGGSTVEGKESLGDELEIEVQDEAKTTGIEDANKEPVVRKNIAFLSPKSFEEETGQSSKENESKSEKFELEDRKDQLIEKSNAEDPSTEAVAEGPVKDFQDKAKEYYEHTEVVTPNANTLEEEIAQNQGETPQKEEELEERTEENKAEEMLESSEHTEVVTYTADSMEEEIARNLDKTPQKEEETKENKEEAMPAHSEQTEVVSPNANTLDEETAQILHETPQKEEEAEEKTKENQMEEIPVYSEQTEVVTPNADILEEEVAQNLDETPQKEGEPEERIEENKVKEMPKQEEREVNQSKDMEIQCAEGSSTVEDKESLEDKPENEVQDEAKSTGIEDANKEQMVEKNITFLSPKSIEEETGQSSKENESKSEKFEREDNRDQLIEKSNAEDLSAEAIAEGPVEDCRDNKNEYSKHNEVVTRNVDNLEEEVGQTQDETPQKEEEPEAKTKENKVEEMPKSFEHTWVVTHTVDSLEEQVVQNLEDTPQKEEEPEDKTKESKVEELPADSEQTVVVTPNADTLEEEVAQNPDETQQKDEEPDDRTKENQVVEMPEKSEQTEVVTPNADTLEEEVAQNLDETPQKDEEPEERTKENKVEEMRKQEEHTINQSKDIKTQSVEGGNTTEDKESLGYEPEKEGQDEPKTACTGNDNKEQIADKYITFLPETLDKEGNTENCSKENDRVSEVLEDSKGTKAVTPIASNLEGVVQNLDETLEKVDNTEESFKADNEVAKVQEKFKDIEKVFPITGYLEGGLSQNLEETLDKEDNIKESVKEDDRVVELLEDSEATELVSPSAGSLEEVVVQSLEEIPHKEENIDDSCKEDYKAAKVPEDSEGIKAAAPVASNLEEGDVQNLEETLNREDNTEESSKEEDKGPKVPEGTEMVPSFVGNLGEGLVQNLEETSDDRVSEVLEDFKEPQVVTPVADNLEGEIVQNVEETIEKGDNTKESSKEDDEVAKVLEDSKGTEVVTPTASNLEERLSQNLEETLDKEDNIKESIKEDNRVVEVPEDSEDTEVVSPSAGSLEEVVVQSLEEIPHKEENIDDSCKEDYKAAKVPEDSEGIEVVAPMAGNLEEGAVRNLEETFDKENTEESSKEDDKVAKMPKDSEGIGLVSTIERNLGEGPVHNLEETLDKEGNIEESFKEHNKVAKVLEDHKVTEAVTPTASNLEGVIQNVEETLHEEEKTEESSKEDEKVGKMPEDSEDKFEEKAIENLDENLDKEENMQESTNEDINVANMAKDAEDTEATSIAKNLDEGAIQDLEETLNQEEKTEESSKGHNVAKMLDHTEDTKAVTSNDDNLEGKAVENLDKTLDKEKNMQDSSNEDNKVEYLPKDFEDTQASSIADNLEKGAVQHFDENLDKEKKMEESSKEDNMKEEECDMIEKKDTRKKNIEEGGNAVEDNENLADKPTKEVCEEFETAAIGTSTENIAENSKLGLLHGEETTKESLKEDESKTMQLKEEINESNSASIERTKGPSSAKETTSDALKMTENDPQASHIIKSREDDEDLVDDSLVSDVSEKDSKEEISAEGETNLKDSASASTIVETEGKSRKEAEQGEEIQGESSSLGSQELELEVAATKGIILDSVETENDHQALHITKAREEDEDLVDDSLVTDVSEKDIKEEIPAEGETSLKDSASASIIVETEGKSHKEAEQGEEIQGESSSLGSQEMELEVAETKGIIQDSSATENDPQALLIIKESEDDGYLVDDYLVSEASEKDIKVEISAEGETSLNDSASASTIVETEGTSHKQAEQGEEIQGESSSLASQEMKLEVAETKGTTLDSVDITAKPEEIPVETDKAIENMEYKRHDITSDPQIDVAKEETTGETMLKHTTEDDLKPSKEPELMITKASETTDETPTKGQSPCENTEAPIVAEATDETLMQKEDKPTDSTDDSDSGSVDTRKLREDVAVENRYGGNLSVHPEPDTEQNISKPEGVEISKSEDVTEAHSQRAICKTKSSENEESSSLGLEKEKVEGEDIMDQQNFTEVVAESSEEGNEVGTTAAEVGGRTGSHGHEVLDYKTLAEKNLNSASPDEMANCTSELVAKDLSNETLQQSDNSKNEPSSDMKVEESDKEIKQEQKLNLEPEKVDKEQSTSETVRDVTLSEQVHEAVQRAENEEIIEQVIQEENEVNELHTVITKDDMKNKVQESSLLEITREALVQKGSEEEEAPVGGSEKPVEVTIAQPEESEGTNDQITEETQNCYNKIDTTSATKTMKEAFGMDDKEAASTLELQNQHEKINFGNGITKALIPRDEESVVEKTQREGTIDQTEASEVPQDIHQQERTAPAALEKVTLKAAELNASTDVMSAGNQDVPRAETLQISSVSDSELGIATGVDSGLKECKHGEDKTTEESISKDSGTTPLFDLTQSPSREIPHVTEHLAEEKETVASKEEMHPEDTETLIHKQEVKEEDEHEKIDSGTNDPVMVEASRDSDVQFAHKKSRSILYKVKHSISKVKKAIIGKSSSHPKPISPK